MRKLYKTKYFFARNFWKCLAITVLFMAAQSHVGLSNKGIAIFKVPAPKTEFEKSWKDKLVAVITKDREIDVPTSRKN